MLCQRCTRLLSSSLRSPNTRPLSTTSKLLRPENPPPATSTSAAQPFSTPFTPSPSKTPGIPSSPSTTPKASSKGPARPPSSVAAGTPLRGLGYIKGQEGPVAKEDSEYPEWLWGLLEPKQGGTDEEGLVGDAFGKLHHSTTTTVRALHSGRGLRSNGFNDNLDSSHYYFLSLHSNFELTLRPHSEIQKATPPSLQSSSREDRLVRYDAHSPSTSRRTVDRSPSWDGRRGRDKSVGGKRGIKKCDADGQEEEDQRE